MLPWAFIAKRRNITVADLGHTTYEEFTKYCSKIKTIPIGEAEWLSQVKEETLNEIVDKWIDEPDLEPIEVKWVSYSEKDLKKMKKKSIQDICKNRGIVYENETKNELIAKILS